MRIILAIIFSMFFCICSFAKSKACVDVLIEGKTASPKVFFYEILGAGKKIFNNPQREFNLVLLASLLGYPDFKGTDESQPVNFALIKSEEKKQFLIFISTQKNSFIARQFLGNLPSKYENDSLIVSAYGAKNASDIIPFQPSKNIGKNLFEIEGNPADVVNCLKLKIHEQFKAIVADVRKLKITCAIQEDSVSVQITLFAKKQDDIKTLYKKIKPLAEELKLETSLMSADKKCVISMNIDFAQFGKIATNIFDEYLLESVKK